MHKHPLIHLPPPQISVFHIKEKIICVRAHRERIFRIEAEHTNNQLIIHNYGQGGAGYTYLFGCVQQALDLFLRTQPDSSHTITVIGAGCYGLLTAIHLSRAGFNVRIVAEQTDSLTSDNAAGFFFPRPRKSANAQELKTFLTLGQASYKEYLSIIHGTHPFLTGGARLVPAYYDIAISPGFEPYVEQGLMNASQRVTIDFNTGKQYAAHQYDTVFVEVTTLMQELRRCVQALNIPIIQEKITNFADVNAPTIFNCTGWGAKNLTRDERLIPVQGHLIALQNQPQPLHYLLNMHVMQQTTRGYTRPELLYFAPKGEGILGITFVRGQDSLTANQHEFDRLLERAHMFFGT